MWDLISLSPLKQAVSYRWVYNVKLNPDGSLTRLKDYLVARGYSQMYDIDYQEIFSPVAKLTFIHLFILFVSTHHWPLHQLDIKNAFLHCILDEEVYIKQPLGLLPKGSLHKFVISKSLYMS